MSNLNIIIAPDQRLLEVSKPVKDINREVKLLLEDMLETMYKNNGIGLAAPQIGILKRLIVMDCSNQNKKSPLKFVNPEILNTSSDKSEYEEGCLSLPTQFAKVERPSYIEVTYQDENGKKINKNFFWARSNLLTA